MYAQFNVFQKALNIVQNQGLIFLVAFNKLYKENIASLYNLKVSVSILGALKTFYFDYLEGNIMRSEIPKKTLVRFIRGLIVNTDPFIFIVPLILQL